MLLRDDLRQYIYNSSSSTTLMNPFGTSEGNIDYKNDGFSYSNTYLRGLLG